MQAAVFALVAIVTVFAVAIAFVRAVHVVLHRALERMEHVDAESRKVLHDRVVGLIRTLRLLAFSVAALASVSFALASLGIAQPGWNLRSSLDWALTHGVNLIVVIVGAAIVLRVGHLAIEQLQHRVSKRHSAADPEWLRRAKTVRATLTNILNVVVWFIALLMVLRELSIDVMPLLTGAGIAGLAIGFGAQNLVRDVISGFFLILEDQVRVGDLARVNTVLGTIEQITLRTVVVRDSEGAVHVFPNGTVSALANLSKQFAYAIVDVRVVYNENIERVCNTIREVGESMQSTPVYGPVLLEPVEIGGVTSIADGFVTINTRFKTLPLNHGKVANEMRRRLLAAFIARGIRPYATF